MKFSQYNTVVEGKDGLVLINIFNSRYVKINKDEDIKHFTKLLNGEIELSEQDEMVKALYQHGYIVQDSVNEYELAKQEVQEYLSEKSRELQILIYVTEQCNFRCIYCPEEHVDKYFSDKHYQGLYKYIETGVKADKFDRIRIAFFGGEPLICANKIIDFLENLEKLRKINPNLLFRHHITTNGYLLEPRVYDKLVSLNLSDYQITVDGFAETHNKTRPLVGGQESWDKIIENLKYINSKTDNAKIVLRTNYNINNSETLIDFKKWEQKNFDNPKFRFAYEPVFKLSDRVPEEHLADQRTESTLELEESLSNNMDLFRKHSAICDSALPNSFTISVDGKITKCNNVFAYDESMFIGYLNEDGTIVFKDNLADWSEDYEMEICKECIIYPICCARNCPVKKALYPKERPDCALAQRYYKDRMRHFIQNKL